MTRIGIQISSVRKFLQTPADVLESFRKVSKIGYQYIQIQWISPGVPMEFIKDALDETRLICIGTQDYTDDVIPELDTIVKMNELWGGKYICVSGIPKRYLSYQGCLTFAQELNQVAKDLQSIGKVLVFHPRSQEFVKFQGQTAVDILFENTIDSFQIGLDLFHVQKAGYDPVQWIHKLRGRMDWVHFKDMVVNTDGQDELRPVGQGSMPWKGIIQACIDTGISYVFAEQETWDKDPFECLAESYEFITAHGIR